MEAFSRVAELEQENARLRDLADGLSPPPASSPSDSSSNHNNSAELEILRMQLSASRQREAELNHQLAMLQQQKEQNVKTESFEPILGSEGTSSGANSPLMTASTLKNVVANPKGGASLGLMVGYSYSLTATNSNNNNLFSGVTVRLTIAPVPPFLTTTLDAPNIALLP